MSDKIPMQLPYGAVYFRKSNPPKKDWERDYARAAEDGFNIFRHWFMWGSIEIAPGKFDWEDYDVQMELAEKYGIKTIIAEITTSVPEWVYYEHPEALCEDKEQRKSQSYMGVSSATGGFYSGLCLDKDISRELVGNFLKELAQRYKGHPALLGYDIWNECNIQHNLCYCNDTKGVFQKWLKKKYSSLETLGKAWHRYSYSSWEQINPPPMLGLYPECIDWLEFRRENACRQMQWRIDTIRKIDENSLISAHGTAQSLENMAVGASDEWMAASLVEVYGLTFVQSRKGSESWKQFNAVDLTRSGAKDKKFWHSEAQGGPLWLQPQVVGRERTDGRITFPQDVRLWNLTSLACGARGILYPRYRPLLDGPLFGAFAPYGMDGSRTPRSEMASSVAKWANDPRQEKLLKASPIIGDVGIIVVPEAQIGSHLLSKFGSEDNYRFMAMGAYKGFFDNNIQADWVHIDDIDTYDCLYLPYPIMLKEAHAKKLGDWVKKGGKLVSEGCPGYFGDLGSVGEVQPNFGLDKVFGVKEINVEFTPDILETMEFEFDGDIIKGGEYIQTYQATTAVPCGYFGSNEIIAAENTYGKGKAIIIGTCVTKGYYDSADYRTKLYFKKLLNWFDISQKVEVNNDKIKCRIQKNENDIFLWLLNTSSKPEHVKFKLTDKYLVNGVGETYWLDGKLTYESDHQYIAEVSGKGAIIFKIGL